MIKKYIPIGAIRDINRGNFYHHVNGVFATEDARDTVTDTAGYYIFPVVSTLELTIDEQTGKVLSVELVKE